MSDAEVSEEIVEQAWEKLDGMLDSVVARQYVRRALEAIAPRLKAEGLREAAEWLRDNRGIDARALYYADALGARADALSPQAKEMK